MTAERLTDLRTIAAQQPGKKSAAILELCNTVEEQNKTITHLRLKTKAPKPKKLGLGETYGVG